MGTVGLSFGSPTSGAGFDVSSTVAAIIGNLQNVETPWKTQLSSLESQDTAISSLGTLFSNLSNDMSSLTDLEGILSQKEGSSSYTNVLTLTAADSSAVAGTHTVTVQNLAQTSSGYLAPVTSASATLSGSISLQVGSGQAQNITIDSSDNTLAGLAEAINASGAGIDASVLTDASGSRLSLVSATSGAEGNIVINSNSIVASGQILSYTGATGASTGTLTGVANAGDTLSGSMTIQVGSGTTETVVVGAEPSSGAAANTVYTGSASGWNTLAGLASAIGTLGVTATVTGNSLSLSTTSGALAVNSSIVDTDASTLGYTSSVTGSNANLTVDGVNLTSASNTVANLIPGVTFQLLAPSATETGGGLEQIQVVIGNDNTEVESTVNQFVTDYNSLVSAINTQEGNNSSGNPEPLFGSPTLSLLQQQLLGGLNLQNPNGSLTSVADNKGTTLSGSMTISAGGGTAQTITVPSSPDNTLAGLAQAINTAANFAPLSYTGVAGSATVTSSGTLTAAATDPLTGAISIQVGDGTAVTVDVPSSPGNTLSDLATAINGTSGIGVEADVTTDSNGIATLTLTSNTAGAAGTLTVSPSILAGIGVTASVVTSGGQSTLLLQSQTAGSGGALAVNSSIVATSDAALTYSDTGGYSSTTADSGTLTAIASAGDTLAGSISIQVGSGATSTIDLPSSPDNTLAGLAGAINAAELGVTASVNTVAVGNNAIGTLLTLTSGTVGSAGVLNVTSNILDAANTSQTTLNYTNSSDINSLTSLGISVNDDGSLTFDATSLDSVLNSDYSSVAGFFQNANSWGQNFSNILSAAGTGSPTGDLALASSSNSNIESTLNADISKENSLISQQQTSLTAELNSANEIMQQLPSELDGVNELYSAITGYDQNPGG
jgi:flagellar hook-associated protein 2